MIFKRVEQRESRPDMPMRRPAFSIRYRTAAFASAVGLVLGVASTTAVQAEDDIVVVSNHAPQVVLPAKNLLVNDGGPTTINASTPAAYGWATIAGDWLTYQPSNLLSTGVDSMHYQPDTIVEQHHTVFFVPRLDDHLVSPNMAELVDGVCRLGKGWVATAPGVVPVADGLGGCALEFPVTNSIVQPMVFNSDPDHLPGPGGGHTEMVIDQDGDALPGSGGPLDNLVASGFVPVGGTSAVVFGLRFDGEDRTIVGVARQNNGTYVETAPAQLSPNATRVGLTWWYASREDMREGGMILEIDDVVVGTRSGIRNSAFYGEAPDWRFGLIEFGPVGGAGTDDVLRLSGRVFMSGQPMRYPHFADHGFGDAAIRWSQVVNTGFISSHTPFGGTGPERRLQVAPGGSNVLLADDTVAGLERYGARFRLGLDTLAIPTFGSTIVLAGTPSSPSKQASPFVVELSWDGAQGYRLRAVASEGPGLRYTPWLPVDPSLARHEIELSWRAAPLGAPTDGGLELTVDGTSAKLENLSNGGLALGTVQVGLISSTFGVQGDLLLDAYEAWK